jgi:hypothetical protein
MVFSLACEGRRPAIPCLRNRLLLLLLLLSLHPCRYEAMVFQTGGLACEGLPKSVRLTQGLLPFCNQLLMPLLLLLLSPQLQV